MNTIIIDDDSDILCIYNDYLIQLGHPEAELVNSPASYFKKHSVEHLVRNYDLVVCDVNMPNVKGNEILKNFVEIRKRLNLYPSFIMITGVPPEYFTFDELGWGSLAAADDILGKPVELSEFESALQRQGYYRKAS